MLSDFSNNGDIFVFEKGSMEKKTNFFLVSNYVS